MGAFSLHVFLVACGRASVECMRGHALFFYALKMVFGGMVGRVCLHIADKGGRE